MRRERQSRDGGRRRRMFINAAVMILLAAVTFRILFHGYSLRELARAVKRANAFYLVLGFFFMFLFVYSEALIIQILMKSFHRKVSFGRAMAYSFTGFYFSSITPSSTGGQPMQAFYMKRDGIGLAQSSFTLLVITSFYQIVMLLYGLVMIPSQYLALHSRISFVKWLLVLGIAANAVCAGFILLVIFKKSAALKLAGFCTALLFGLHIIKDREAVSEKLKLSIEEYSQGGLYLRKHPSVCVSVFLITVFQLTAMYGVPYCVYLALGIGTKGAYDFIAMQAVLCLAVSAVPLPGAVGASEGSFMVVFRSLFPVGLLLPSMLLSRGISFYGFLAVSGLAVLLLHFTPKKG